MAMSGWLNAWQITIDETMAADGDLVDFDLLLTRACLPDAVCSPTDARRAQADGSDLRFSTDANGENQLAWDRIKFELDSADGAGDAVVVLRVKVPSILQSGGATIYLHAGNAGATLPAADSEFGQYATYPATTKGYWPLCDDPSGSSPQMRDRTANQNHGICEGTVTSASTPTGGGVTLSGGHIRIPDDDSLEVGTEDFTFSCAVKIASAVGYQAAMSKEGGYDTGGWNVVSEDSTGKLRTYVDDGSSVGTFASSPNIADDTRRVLMVAFARDGNASGFVDGDAVGTIDISATSATSLGNAMDLRMGVQGDGSGDELTGVLDTARLEIGVVRDATWAGARSRNETTPATYITPGSQVTSLPPVPRVHTPPQTMRPQHDLIW